MLSKLLFSPILFLCILQLCSAQKVHFWKDKTCSHPKYYAEAALLGISEKTDLNGVKKYYIILDEKFFWNETANVEVIRDTITKLTLLSVQEGYNELIYDQDTFRITIKNGQLEGWYHYNNPDVNRMVSMGAFHRNYRSGPWFERTKGTRGNFINHYAHYKRGCLHGDMMLLLNDSMLLMKGRYRNGKQVGRWLIADGTMSDPRVMGDKDSLYFREEIYRKDNPIHTRRKVYAGSKADFSIKYLWLENRNCLLSKKTIQIEYYPNGQMKRHMIHNDKKKQGIEKTYDESGKLIEKKRIS